MATSLPQPQSSSSTKTNDVERVVNFSKSTFDALQELANLKNHGSIADALRDSIALSKWFSDNIKDSDKVLIEREGKIFEVIRK